MWLLSCGSPNPAPRPPGYIHIEIPQHTYKAYNGDCPFETEISEIAELVPDENPEKGYCYQILEYPRYKASVYLAYTVPGDSLGKLLSSCHKLAYSHDVKAGKIEPELIKYDSTRVFGQIYHIMGNAASYTQFYVTDSINHFVRGALYFYAKPNYDSIAPVLTFVNDDIRHLLRKLKWKK
jgi:gliding motility-associated lipoprotein GldD